MRHPCFSLLISSSYSTTNTTTGTTSMPSSVSSSSVPKPRKPSNSTTNHHHHHHSSHQSSSPIPCRHSPTATATLDLLILILVLFSGTFLLTSYFSYIFNSLSLVIPPLVVSHSSILQQFPYLYVLGFIILFAILVIGFDICFGFRSRKCGNPKCKGLKKAMEFDLQLQTEECLKSGTGGTNEIDKLPWKGGTEANPDYECLRAELRKMAPPNGRAVLLFRAKCGCPVAKLVGWSPKRGRRPKKAIAHVPANGVHR